MRTHFETLHLRKLDESMLEAPLVTSLLEDDFYKFSMGEFLFNHPELAMAHMTWKFKNRSQKISLKDFITEDDFQKEYAHVRKLRATNSELHYLRGTNEYDTRMFSEPYLNHLAHLAIPEATFAITNGEIDIEVTGPWSHSTHAEMPVMKIVNGLFYRSQLKTMSRLKREAYYAEGIKRLNANILRIREFPSVTFSDFGNRRRFGALWQDFVVARCAEELPKQFKGTSNTELAAKYSLMPIGTCAHELTMGIAALRFNGTKKSLADAFVWFHDEWWKKYGWGLSIRLPDTFGTKFAYEVLPDSNFREWKGERIDSKPPMEAIPLLIEKYKSLGVDPREKMAIPSDALDAETMIKVAEKFKKDIKVTFGWGTKLTNNLGFDQLPIVMKPHMISGKACIKIPDNVAKTMGIAEDAEEYKQVLGYTEKFSEEPVV